MKLFPAAAAALVLTAANTAFADPLIDALLDFETVSNYTSILGYYNGGADGAGAVGPALGVAFNGDALGLQNDGLGAGVGGAYFSNAPSPVGVMTPVGADSTMNVAGGFANGLAFFYSSSDSVVNGVQIWSGLNGTGTLLASVDLSANAQAGGCTDSPFCHFDQAYGSFAGTAHSVTFGNAASLAGFDNIHVGAVPEADSAIAMALGLAGLLAAVSRRRRG